LNFEDFAFLESSNREILLKNFESQYFSVRWTGLLSAKHSEVYTLKFTCSGSVRFYINDVLILIKSATPKHQGVEGTVTLLQSEFVDVRIDYVHHVGPLGVKLEWRSASQPNVEVSRSSAFWHSESGVMTDIVLSAINGNPSMSSTKFYGSGLTIATAGIASYFTISITDAIGLPAELMSDLVWTKGVSVGGPSFSSIRQTRIRSDAVGSLVAEYNPLIAGEYFFEAVYLKPGALGATLYADSMFSVPLPALSPPGLSLDSNLFSESPHLSSLRFRMSAKWKGFFKPVHSAITTFYIRIGSSTDKVKLTVDGNLLIDRTAIGIFISTNNVSATLLLSDANAYYDIDIEFSHSSGALDFSVGTESGFIPSNHVFSPTLMATPSKLILLVKAGHACASTSKVLGVAAVKVVTADVRRDIELHVRDAYHNPASLQAHHLRAIAYHSACSETSIRSCDAEVSFETHQVAQSVWNIAVLLTRSGRWNIAVSLSQPGSLSATYYAIAGFVSPLHAGHVLLNAELDIPAASVRMSGFIKLFQSQNRVSFSWSDDHVYYPSLFIKSPFGGERSAHYTTSQSVPAGSSRASAPVDIQPLKIDAPYLHSSSGPCLMWSYENEPWTAVPSNRLFTREDVLMTSIDVVPGESCSATSSIGGSSVTVATCGVATVLSIFARDMFSNLQNSIQGKWIVRVFKNSSLVALTMSELSNDNPVVVPGLAASAVHTISSNNHSAQKFTFPTHFTVYRPSLSGLTGSYFPNSDLYGEPALTQIDHTTVFEWNQVLLQCCKPFFWKK
jgi:hypothetical protein